MKKCFLTAVVLIFLFSAETLSAHFPVSMSITSRNNNGLLTSEQCSFSPLQLGIGPFYDRKLQLFSGDVEIPGIALGLLGLEQKSAIFSFALLNGLQKNYFLQSAGFYTVADRNYGLSIAPLWTHNQRNYGLQAGLINTVSESGSKDRWGGIQIGLFNKGGSIQIGLLNFTSGLIPCMPLIGFPIPGK